MDNLIAFSDLELSFNSEAFVLKTQQQIAKDFAVIQQHFPENFETEVYSKEQIESFLKEKISYLIQHSEAQFGQLLYTIDIPEKQFRSLTSSPEFVSKMAEVILRREAYKVFLRIKFSKSSEL